MKKAICDFRMGGAKAYRSAMAVARFAGTLAIPLRLAVTLALPLIAFAVAALPSFADVPYDAKVEYLESPMGSDGKNPYIDTGLYPGDDMGAHIRFMPLRTADSTLCGAQTTGNNKWYFGGSTGSSGRFYMSWMTNPPNADRPAIATGGIYEIYFNHLNDRYRKLYKEDGTLVKSLDIGTTTWTNGTGALCTIWLYHFNDCGARPAYYHGNYRIYSAQFTQGDSSLGDAAVVMNLIPVIKDGVGYMYDTVNNQLLGKVEGSSSAEFVCGRSIIETSKTLEADEDWTHLGQLLISSGVTIDLNGHTLRIVGADGEGTITSSDNPGLLRVTAPSSVATPVTVTTNGNLTVLRSRKPYDAQVEYLEAPAVVVSGKKQVPYIDTGLKPANDLGVRLRVEPLHESDDTTVCGALSTVKVNNKNVDWRWYMGFINKTNGYLPWGTGNPTTRFKYSPNTVYDIIFNHFNNRNRRVEQVGGDYTFDLSIGDAWPSGATHSIYLFAYNNKGTAGNTGNARIYSAQFTRGSSVVMDLIPVRKDGVGYMYDKVSEKLLAKVATAPLAFTYVNDAAGEAYIEGNVTLNVDADWTSRGILRMDEFAMIDLNGHSLTIAGALGTGAITNSSETVGEVHFVTPTGEVQTCSLALLGNLKVFKEGDGTLSLNRAGQTFTGGVEVAAGVASAVADESGSYWGASGGVIRVSSGATFSVNGKNSFYYKDFVLNGGTLANKTANMSSTAGIGNVTLEADSAVNLGSYQYTYFASPIPATFDLGGHKLTVNAEAGGQFCISFPIVNGTLEYQTGGYLSVPADASSGSPTLDLKMLGAAFYGEGESFSVSNYLASYSQQWNHGSYQVKVYGTFKPDAVDADGRDYFHGCEMQHGSTIDLSAKTATWDTTSTGWSGTGDADGARTVTFAEGARVTLDLHGRTLTKGAKIVNWAPAPENLDTLTFVLDVTTAEAGESLVVTESGIYYGADENTVAHAYWTGAIDNDLTKSGNWACTNFMGGAVADGVPGASSAVHVSGEVGFQIPAAQPLTCDSIVFSNVTLTNDCDWSGLTWAAASEGDDFADMGSVDLNGHNLQLATTVTSESGFIYDFVTFAVTNSAAGKPGELHIVVPEETTYLVCSGFALSGNVKLVKEGQGWLAMVHANQTFTGGVLIAEGTGYSPLRSHPETGDYWGPSNGTITVAANATFDARGNNNFYRKHFVLDGGTLANTDSMVAAQEGFGNVTLVADSYFVTVESKTTKFSAPNGTEKIDLGGHTLTLSLAYGDEFYFHVPAVNGTMVFNRFASGRDGGYLHINSDVESGSPTVNFDVRTTAFKTAGTLSVSNYVARYTGGYNHGAGAVKVYGTFKPAAVLSNGNERFHGCEMQSGSFIDLSEKTGAWSSIALGYSGTGDADGNRTTTFVNDSTVGILLGTRKVKSEEKIIDWSSAAPANRDGLEFFGQFSNGRRITLKVKDDGLYAPRSGLIIVVR